MSCLLEAAERTLGHEESDNKLIKQLAYENANSSCKAVLRGKVKDFNEMIHLCRDVDNFTHKVSQAVQLAIGAAFQHTNPQTGCFKCSQYGRFTQQFPTVPPSTNIPQSPAGATAQPTQPNTLCPRCKKDKHWANKC